MIENIENIIQLVLTCACTVVSFRRIFFTPHRRAWLMIGLSSFAYFLGDLYWQLYLVFYAHTPPYSHIPDISWLASYMFLILLISEIQHEDTAKHRSRILWLAFVFTAGMCVFYSILSGDYISNVLYALIMGVLIWKAADGLLYLRRYRISAPGKRLLYYSVLILCASEYISWTASCFWMGDTLFNPYFLANLSVSVSFLLLLSSLEKAVKE